MKLPKLPKISLPKISFPKVSMPKISMPKISMPNVSMPKLRIPRVSEAYNAGGYRRDLQLRVMYHKPISEEDKTKEDLAAKLTQNEENRTNYNFLEKAIYNFGYNIADVQIRSIEKGMDKSRRRN